MPGLKLEHLLLVDDAAINREILANFLDGVALQIDEAGNGLDALALFKSKRYNAVLLDIEMPGIDGYTTLRELRAWEREQNLPPTLVLAVTSSDLPDDEERILAAGATAYLAKPVKQRALIAALKFHHGAMSGTHPMEDLLPKLFSYANETLDEIECKGFDDLVAISKKLHELRGALATFGFEDFAEHLKQIQVAAQRGERPDPEEFSAAIGNMRKALQFQGQK